MTPEERVYVAHLPQLLGLSADTVRRRIRELDVETFPSAVDARKRLIRKSDIDRLRRAAPPATQNGGEVDNTLVPVDALPALFGVSDRTIRRWLAADGVETIPFGSGERAVRFADIVRRSKNNGSGVSD